MKHLELELCSLTVYRGLLDLPIIKQIAGLLEELNKPSCDVKAMISDYTGALYALASKGFVDISGYIRRCLQFDESPFAVACSSGEPNAAFEKAAVRDIAVLNRLIALDHAELKRRMIQKAGEEYRELIISLPQWEPGKELRLDAIKDGYRENGCGIFSGWKAFIWENREIIPVQYPDTISQEEMVGYEWQREEVIKNTRALIRGSLAANVLLYGDSGTGKSATVKSLINISELSNLRIIEITRDGIEDMRGLIQLLVGKSQKFILFIDDLSLTGENKVFSSLKSILEGGLGLRPQNVVVYATSNRRHIVQETFSERAGDDVHVSETIQERTSLSDRFGLRIPYLALSKAEYLETVERMASQAGLNMDRELLRAEAGQWSISHAGRTPRIARQFIESKLQ